MECNLCIGVFRRKTYLQGGTTSAYGTMAQRNEQKKNKTTSVTVVKRVRGLRWEAGE